MVKVSTTTISVPVILKSNSQTFSLSTSYDTQSLNDNITIPSYLQNISITISWTYTISTVSTSPSVWTYKNWTAQNDWVSTSNGTTRTYTFTKNTTWGDYWSFWVKASDRKVITASRSDYWTITYNLVLQKVYNYQWKPRSTAIISIWSKESTTIYWVHIDNTRFTQS